MMNFENFLFRIKEALCHRSKAVPTIFDNDSLLDVMSISGLSPKIGIHTRKRLFNLANVFIQVVILSNLLQFESEDQLSL